MLLPMGAFFSLLSCLFVHGFFLYSRAKIEHGMFDFDLRTSDITIFFALFLGTTTGIFTSLIIEHFHNENKITLNKRRLWTAFAIAPIVMGGFYDKIVEIHSFWVVFILAHQNGFFWENVSTRIR